MEVLDSASRALTLLSEGGPVVEDLELPPGKRGEEEPALCATQVEGNVSSTFYALVHLFERAPCKRMPPARVADGRLQNEIYRQIIKHVTDMETRESCMEVSRTFRLICQEDLLFAEGIMR